MNGAYETMMKHAESGRGASRWLAIAVVAAIGVIWILPATALRDGCIPPLAKACAMPLRAAGASRGTPGAACAW